jgi:hypothetical protein
MPNLEKVLGVLVERNLKLTLESDDVELLEIKSSDKTIDLEIKNREEFKKLIKELRK